MKKNFHVFFLFVLFAFLAVNSAWAAALCPSSLQEDSDGCYVNMPVTGKISVNITADDITNGLTSFKVYDDGGKGGNYSIGAGGYLTLNAPEGFEFVLTGSVNSYYDDSGTRFVVYDGYTGASWLIFEDGDVQINQRSSGNIITIIFQGYSGDTDSGLDLLVTVIPTYNVTVSDVDGGSVTTDKEKAAQGELVTLTITPASDYLFDKLEVTYGDNGAVSVTRIGNTATFTMPAANVTVTATFEKQPRKVEISEVIGGTVTVDEATTTYGATVKLSITPDASNDYLFEGIKVVKKGTTEEITVDVTNVAEAVGGFATFTMPASDVTVTPTWKKKQYGVTVKTVDGGSVSTDKEKATPGETVTLTIVPDLANDYELTNLEVTYGENGSVTVTRTGNTATFTMPAASVTVTPSFALIKHSVTIVSVDGGSVEADMTTATKDETVMLTITPDVAKDYVFKGFEVKDVAGNVNVVAMMSSTEGKFVMPASDVTVTPSFAKVERSVIITNVTGGTVTTDNATTTYGETVTLTIAPTSGHHLNSLAVKDAAENDVNVTLSNDKTKATFKMPKSNVTVNPFWNAELIKDGEGYYVNMPVVGTNTLDLAEYIANGITSFKVYDDGGKDGNYNTDHARGILALNAPEGFVIQIKGTWTLNDASVTIDDENGSKYGPYGSSTGTENTNEVSYLSTDSSVNIVLSTSEKYTASGLDFAVNVVPVQGVVVKNVAGGKISTDKSTADAGATVTLTATPDEGYMLNSISVVDLHGNSVAVNGGSWYIGAKTMTFTMPTEAVFVTPLFVPVGDIFVNVPKKGKNEVVVLEGVESFNVYDYGGKDGNYSEASNGTLQLTAPENYVFQISGSAQTVVARDFLRIYDGNVVAVGFLLSNETSGSIDLNGANVLTSTNNVITITFYSTGLTNGRGFDLKVTLVKPSYGAVSIAKADDGKIHATINGDYAGKDTLVISEAIEVDAVDYNRELEVDVPVTALLPVTLPAGTTVNAEFYTLEKVEQVEGMKWQAIMKYIGDGNLPQPNTPYAVILPTGQSELKFDLPSGKKATVQTGDINKVCGVDASCKLDENGKITDDWFFTGTYAYKEWKEDDEELGLAYAFSANDNPGGAAKGKFGKIKIDENSSEYPRAKAMRCYLRKRDANVKLQQQNQAQMVAASPYVAKFSINNLPETIDVEFVKDDAKGGRTVLHGRMNTVTGEFKMLRDYDLKGRKVNSTNRARGAYYGKKVMKK